MSDERSTTEGILLGSFIASAACLTLVALGVIIGMLLRKRDNELSGGFFGYNPMLPPQAVQFPVAVPVQAPVSRALAGTQAALLSQGQTEEDYSNSFSPREYMATITLSKDTTQQLFNASGGYPWHVEVRVIKPPGEFALFSLDSSSNPDFQNTHGSLVVPSGGFHDLDVPAGRGLYARGTIDGVMVSFTARQVRG